MSDERCPQGRTDYEACFAPFRYCPVKGCGRTEAEPEPEVHFAECPACGHRVEADFPIRVIEHVHDNGDGPSHVVARRASA